MIKHNYKLNVFVGDVSAEVCIAALAFSSDAFLLDSNNCELLLESTLSKDTTVYTSLCDVSPKTQTFIDICLAADQITYCPPLNWADMKHANDFDPTSSDQGLTEYLLSVLSEYVPVNNLSLDIRDPNPLVDNRRSANKQLWVAGCSFSHGYGVSSSQRYGELVSKSVNLPCSFLTRPGAAIDWAVDQICRSDVQENDVVILGITNIERITYIYNHRLLAGVNVKIHDSFSSEIKNIIPKYHLVTENTFYQHVYAIERVINFCKKTKANLVLFGLLSICCPNLVRYLVNKKNYFSFPYKLKYSNKGIQPQFSDYGFDSEHPGPLQHQHYSDYLVSKLKNLNFV